jgi:hypothetical protein
LLLSNTLLCSLVNWIQHHQRNVVVAAADDKDDYVVGCGVKVDLLKHDKLQNYVSFLSITAMNRTAGFYVGPTWWE